MACGGEAKAFGQAEGEFHGVRVVVLLALARRPSGVITDEVCDSCAVKALLDLVDAIAAGTAKRKRPPYA